MYYPLSQITTNLYTNGNEFVSSNTRLPYIGYYWKNSQGKYFTGKTPQDTPFEEIININSLDLVSINEANVVSDYSYDSITTEYLNLKNVTSPPPSPPTYFATSPTQKDYQNGEFRRYFCKKTNEIIYLEISKNTYDKLNSKDPNIAYQYYLPFNIPWQLTGNSESDVYEINRNIVKLTMFQQKLPMFDKYLRRDFTKYYFSKTTTTLEGRVVTNFTNSISTPTSLEGRVVTNFTNPTALEGRVVTNRGRANNTDSSM